MLLFDVNVCLYAMRADSAHHDVAREWLEQRLVEAEPVGVSELVLSSLVRISTNHRVYAEPSTAAQAMAFCGALLDAPAAHRVRTGPRHWAIFAELVRRHQARGNDVPDTYLAALALENNATWVTTDRGFARFQGLRLLNPFNQ